MSPVVFDVHPDAAAAAEAAAARLIAVAEAGGHIALSGGSTPARAYEIAARGDWSRAHVWFGDDRCVPPDDERSNYLLARRTLLDRLAAAPVVHRIQGELSPEEAADVYDTELTCVTLDLVLNGLGGDGHTASLFPGSPALQERTRRAVAAEPGLEPFVPRVTMTIPMLNSGRAMLFLVAGADKAAAVRQAFAAPPSPATPASLVRSAEGPTVVVLDEAAASLLDN